MKISLQSLNPVHLLPTDRKLTPQRLTILFGLVISGGLALYAVVSHLRHRRIQKQLEDDHAAARTLSSAGNAAFDRGDFARAIDLYTQALERAAPSLRMEINYQSCKAYLKNKQLDKALGCYKAFVQGNLPLNAKAKLAVELALEIGSYLEKEKTAEARVYYDQAKANLPLVDPALVEIFIGCSQAYLNLGEFDLATECCTIALTPLTIPVHEISLRLQLGAIEEMRDNIHKASEHYHKTESLPASYIGLSVRVWIALSQIYRKRKELPKALEYCERALITHDAPTELLRQAHYSKGWILFDQGDTEGAEREAKTAQENLSDSSIDLHVQITILQGHIWRKKGQLLSALSAEEEASKLHTSRPIFIEIHLALALSQYTKSMAEGFNFYYSASPLADHAETDSTLKAFLYLNAALSDLKHYRLQNAERELRAAETCSFEKPFRKELLRYLLEPYQDDPALTGAQILQRMIQQKLQEIEPLKKRLLGLGKEAYEIGDYPKAAHLLEEAKKIGPVSVDLYLSLSRVYLKLKHFAEAGKYASKAAYPAPDPSIQVQIDLLRGQIQIGRGYITAAISHFEAALQAVTDPDLRVEIQKGLIQAHQRSGQFQAFEIAQSMLNDCSIPGQRAEIYYSQSITFMLKGNTQEAEQSALQGLKLIEGQEIELTGQFLILLSMMHQKQGDNPKALEEVSAALKVKMVDRENLIAAHLQRALCYEHKESNKKLLNYPEAQRSYQQVFELIQGAVYHDPFLYNYIYFRRAQCHLQQLDSPECTNPETVKENARINLDHALDNIAADFVTFNDLLYCIGDLRGTSQKVKSCLKEKIEFEIDVLKGK